MLKNLPTEFNIFLVLTLVIVAFGILPPEAAASGSVAGRTPFTGVVIENNYVEGRLAQGETIWYKFAQPEQETIFQQKMQVNLILTPNQSDYVNLSVYSFDQAQQWHSENFEILKGLGDAAIISVNNATNIGEIDWTGEIASNQTYYIRVVNDSDFVVDYGLSIHIDKIQETVAELKQPTAQKLDVAAANTVEQPAVTKLPAGIDPNHPEVVSLAPGEINVTKGRLAAGEDRWLSMKVTELGGPSRLPLNLTMFVTPGDGNMIHKVHMDLFPSDYAAHWSSGNFAGIYNFGAGRIVDRNNDPLVGEFIWNGNVNNNEAYYIRLRNDNAFDVDYWLFTGDIINTELDKPQPTPTTAKYVAPGTDPNYALPLVMGLNNGELEPGQDRWFSMSISDLDDSIFETIELSLYYTPNDGNNLHKIHLDLFDGAQRNIWSRGTLDHMRNFGAASITTRDNNPETGELVWNGRLIDSDTYYIRLRNDSANKIDYWLFTGQIINPSLDKLIQ